MSSPGYLIPSVINPPGYKCVLVKVPDNPGHTRAFWGHLFELARWWNWEREENHYATEVAKVWNGVWSEALDTFIQTGGVCPVDTRTTNTTEYTIGGPTGGLGCEEEENMTPIIHIGGIAYLTENCGCDTRFYRLTPAIVNIDDAGNAEVLDESQTEPGYNWTPIGDSYLSCYAAKAVPYLLDRAKDFTNTYLAVMTSGLDAVAAGIDEFLDIGAVVLDILGMDNNGFVDLLRGWTTEELDAAWDNQDFRDTMEENWTFTGPVSKQDLKTWVATAPAYVDGVPLKVFMTEWVGLSLILNYNENLALFAAECSTGRTLSEINGELGGYDDHEYSGVTYRVWAASPAFVSTVVGTTYYPDIDTDGYDILGMYADITVGSEGVGQWQIALNATDYYLMPQQAAGSTSRLGTHEEAIAEAVIEDYTGQAWTSYAHNINAGLPTGYKSTVHSFGAAHTINNFYVVGRVQS